MLLLVILTFVLTSTLSSDIPPGMEEDLLRATTRNNFRMVEILLKEGTDMNCREPKTGLTPLHIATRNGHYGIVEALLKYGANPNKKDLEYGFTALLIASYNGNYSVVKLLLDKGANPNESEGKTYQTPLHIAAQKGYLDIVKLLIEKKADFTLKDASGRNFLDKAHPMVRDYYRGITLANSEYSIREGCRAMILDLNEIGFNYDELSRKGQGIFFQRIYEAYHSFPNFSNCLTYYLDKDLDKYYWIGLFLFDEEHTSIVNFPLAKELLQKAIKLGEDKSITASTYYVLGLAYWRENKRTEARAYFDKAYQMSERHPGSIPALSLDEKVEIDKFMGIRD